MKNKISVKIKDIEQKPIVVHPKIKKSDIKDELCTCGHLKTEHNNQHNYPSENNDGHGNCKVCACKQFTWKSFVLR